MQKRHNSTANALELRLFCINSSPPGQNGHHFADNIFKYIFHNENVRYSIQISLEVFPKGPIDQSHRYGRHQAACREPAGSYDKTTRTAICFEHKTQYLLIRVPYTRIVVFWHISNIPPMISAVKLVVIPPRFI